MQDVKGHRTDRSEYYTVDDGLILQKAVELQAEGFDSEEIVERVAIEPLIEALKR